MYDATHLKCSRGGARPTGGVLAKPGSSFGRCSGLGGWVKGCRWRHVMRSRRSTPGSTPRPPRRTGAGCSGDLVAVTGLAAGQHPAGDRHDQQAQGPSRAVTRKPRALTCGYDTRKFLIEVWTLIGEPCGKYLAPIMAPTVAQLEAFGELGKVADRLSAAVRDQLVKMSAATIDTDAQTHQGRPRGEVRDPPRGHAAVVDRGTSAGWMRWSTPGP